MPEPTDFEIKCRGCCDGDFLPLNRKTKKIGIGRFYYTHARGCKHMENFDPDITDIDNLKKMVPNIVIQKKLDISLAKGRDASKKAIPLAKEITQSSTNKVGETPSLAKEKEDNTIGFFGL